MSFSESTFDTSGTISNPGLGDARLSFGRMQPIPDDLVELCAIFPKNSKLKPGHAPVAHGIVKIALGLDPNLLI